MEDNQLQKMIRLLRLRVTVNFFKMCVLKDMHLAGKPQAPNMFDTLNIGDEKILTKRGWEKWFDGSVKKLQGESGKLLDELAKEKIVLKSEDDAGLGKLPEGFFQEMSNGGLVSKLLKSTNSTNVKKLLIDKAQEYSPASFLHLHIDAIEVNAITKDFHDVPWNEVLEIASRRILEILFKDWGPRYGQIYSSFSSSLKLQWDSADEEERDKISEFYSKFGSFLFEGKMQDGAEPDWQRIGVDNDVAPQHVYKTLFAMAADTDFLVADRLEAWTISLATAALAMHALAWSDRYTTMGVYVTEEMVFWSALDHIMFDCDTDEVDFYRLRSAMARCQAEWDEGSLDVFMSARSIYHDGLLKYGISIQDVLNLIKTAKSEHPLVYRG